MEPVGSDVNAVALTVLPAQIVRFEGIVTVGVGLTVMVNVVALPTHPAVLVPVTEIVATMFAVVEFAPVKDAILPVPLAASPIAVLEFVQAKVELAILLVKEGTTTVFPAQAVMLVRAVTIGFGFIVIV